jgi:hypothetical protein
MPYWDERVQAMAGNYTDIEVDKYHIDILTANFVMHPTVVRPGLTVAATCLAVMPWVYCATTSARNEAVSR